MTKSTFLRTIRRICGFWAFHRTFWTRNPRRYSYHLPSRGYNSTGRNSRYRSNLAKMLLITAKYFSNSFISCLFLFSLFTRSSVSMISVCKIPTRAFPFLVNETYKKTKLCKFLAPTNIFSTIKFKLFKKNTE